MVPHFGEGAFYFIQTITQEREGMLMQQSVTAETALRNEIASAEMEGYRFEPDEIELVKACLGGEISYQVFLERVLREPEVC